MNNLLEPTPKLRKRYRAETRFKRLGLSAIVLSLSFVFFLFYTIISDGYSAFTQTFVEIEVSFDHDFFSGENISNANFPGLVKNSMRKMFPEVKGRKDKKLLYSLISPAIFKSLSIIFVLFCTSKF